MGELLTQLMPYLITILSIVIVYAAGKWLKITLQKEQVERILAAIINVITNVEQENREMPGIEKQKRVVREIEQGFPDKDKSIIQKVYGGVEVAVEKAFQISHLAGKVVKFFN